MSKDIDSFDELVYGKKEEEKKSSATATMPRRSAPTIPSQATKAPIMPGFVPPPPPELMGGMQTQGAVLPPPAPAPAAPPPQQGYISFKPPAKAKEKTYAEKHPLLSAKIPSWVKQIPAIGPAVEGSQQLAQNFQHNPYTAAIQTARGIPAGIAQNIDTLTNLVRGVVPGLGAITTPSNMEKDWLNLTQGLPGNTQGGARSFGSTIGNFAPLGVPAAGGGSKVIIPALAWMAKHPIMTSVAAGPAVGAGYSAATDFSRQQQRGEKGVNWQELGESAKEGAKAGAVLGVGGAGLAKAGKMLSGRAEKNVKGEVAPLQSETPKMDESIEAGKPKEKTPVEMFHERQQRKEEGEKLDLEHKKIRNERSKLRLQSEQKANELEQKHQVNIERLRAIEQEAKEAKGTAAAKHAEETARLTKENKALDLEIKRLRLAHMEEGEHEDFDYTPIVRIPPKNKNIVLEDGSEISPEDASVAAVSKETPEEVRNELRSKLKGRALEGGGRVKNEVVGESEKNELPNEGIPNEEKPNSGETEAKKLESEPVQDNPELGAGRSGSVEGGGKSGNDNAVAPRFEVRERKPGIQGVWDTESNDWINRSNMSKKEASKRAENLNAKHSSGEELNLNQGKKPKPPEKGLTGEVSYYAHPHSNKLNENAVERPDWLPLSFRENLDELADAKHEKDLADAHVKAFKEARGAKPKASKGGEPPSYSEEEGMFNEGREPQMAVNSHKRPGVKYDLKDQKPETLDKRQSELEADAKAAGERFELAKGKVAPDFRASVENETNPLERNINIPHEKGPVNVRLRPAAKNVKGIPGGILKRFVSEESGAGVPGYAADVVGNALKGGKQFSDEHLSWMWDTDKTIDAAGRIDKGLARDIQSMIVREHQGGHGLDWTPEEAKIADEASRMTPDELFDNENFVKMFGNQPKKLNYLIDKSVNREALAGAVRNAIDMKRMEHDGEEVPPSVENDLQKLRNLEERLRGRSPFTPRTGWSKADQGVIKGERYMYDFFLKDNPGFNALVRFHYAQVLPLRVGGKTAAEASHLLSTDEGVRKWASGLQVGRNPFQEAMHEGGIEGTPEGKTLFGRLEKIVPGVAKPTVSPYMRTRLMDQMNFQDSVVSGFIEHGNQIKYPGGGVQLAKDIASGKASPEVTTEAWINAIDVADKTTGMGYFGLNPNVIQDTQLLKHFVLFTGQRYRVLGLQKQYIGEALNSKAPFEQRMTAVRKLGAFTALTVALGGEAVLPKEVDIIEDKVPQLRPYIRGMKDVLNHASLFQGNIRDVSEKVRNTLIPGLGGVEANLVMQGIATAAKDISAMNFKDADWRNRMLVGLTILELSRRMGGGGTTMGRLASTTSNVAKQDKNIYASRDYFGEIDRKTTARSTFSKIEGHPYGIGEGIVDQFAPGVTPKVGAWQREKRREAVDKE